MLIYFNILGHVLRLLFTYLRVTVTFIILILSLLIHTVWQSILLIRNCESLELCSMQICGLRCTSSLLSSMSMCHRGKPPLYVCGLDNVKRENSLEYFDRNRKC